MVLEKVWVVQSFGSEGNAYSKAFSSEDKAIKHYRELIEEAHKEFANDYGENYLATDYEEIDGIHCTTFDSEKYSERIEITSLIVH